MTRSWLDEISGNLRIGHIKTVHYFGLMLFVIIEIVGLHYLSQHFINPINLSTSLPQSAYLIEKGSSFSRGDKVLFSYQEHKHLVYTNGTQMVKIVAGVPGDKVEFKGHSFFINGKYFGKYKDYSIKGVKLVPNKSHVLGKDEYFMYATNPDSFDSRYVYMGYVKKSQILGKVILDE
ncbi:signal peptidase I [Hydrogenovibrio marinus]|uniref:Signal peptidase I n=1 Tax=Hydrogenovibrio marinus TaxID=28885 RepID=A0A066ZLP3_HYDMR|nr:signal peptidase I [Hydrogenovibrio marinus]KDN94713.1 hypothetical protein EI16_12515 [Hydrogenovibrio marinus]